MKKIFTILCAIAIAFSASAVQVASRAEMKKASMEQLQNRQVVSHNHSVIPALSVNSQEGLTSIVKANHQASVKPAIRRAANVVAQDINITAVEYVYDKGYYDVYLTDGITVYIWELLEDLQYGKTYTITDMYPDWVCTLTAQGYPDIPATDATLIVTKDQDGLIHAVGTMVLNGDNHIVTYDQEPLPVATDTIPVVMQNIKISDYTAEPTLGAYQIMGSNEDYISISIAAEAPQLVGTVSEVWLDYTGMYVDENTMIEILAGNGEVTAGVNEGEYDFSFYLLSKDAHCYNVTGHYAIPHAESTVDFVATDLVIDDSYFDLYLMFYGYGIFFIDATNANAEAISLQVESMDAVSGTFTEGVSGTVCGSDVYSANITVDKAAMTVTGSVLCYNNVQYNLDLSFETPEPRETLNVVIDDAIMYDYCEEEGWWQAITPEFTGEYYISLSPITAYEVEGTYAIEDMDLSYTLLYRAVDADTIGYSPLTCDLEVDVEGDAAIITGTMLAWNAMDHSDVILFNLDVTATFDMGEGIDEIEAVKQAMKVIRNGQVIIRKEGKEFTVQGAEL